ncbi:MAG TPA: trypsin-like peptidase domain-containing protein [Anaeromyxobacteraceae bacterium]
MQRHIIVSSLIVFAIASGCAMEGRADAGPPATSPAPISTQTGKQLWHDSSGQHAVQVSVPGQTSLAPLVKQLKPAVVNISSTTVMKNPHRGMRHGQGAPGGGDEDEQQMFERFFGQREMPEELKGTSLGSGFIINEDGYILTNNHVVKDATDIKVRLADGRELGAKVVGKDAASDVALLKLVEMKGKLPTVALGDSDALEQGDYVLAIGSPLGFRESVTFGIVSAKDRSLTGGPFDDFLQTDAAINQGNSGGPLFNIKGEVVGINTAIISPQIGSGIGFAVPINMAKQIVPQLLAGKVTRGYLGVSVSELTPDLAQGFGLKEGTKGALVQAVVPKAPADKAGVKAGDVVVSVNGKPVDSPSTLTRSVAAVQPGGKVSLSLLRGTDRKDIQVTVAQRPDEEAIARGETGPGDEEQGDESGGATKKGTNDKLGIRISALTPQIAQQLGAQPEQGVLVVAVSPDGPAGSAGIRKNDIILEVNRQPVSKVEQVVGTVQKLKPGQVVVLRVARGQQAMYLPVKLGGDKADKN